MEPKEESKSLTTDHLNDIMDYASAIKNDIKVMKKHFIKNDKDLHNAVCGQIKKLLQLIQEIVSKKEFELIVGEILGTESSPEYSFQNNNIKDVCSGFKDIQQKIS